MSFSKDAENAINEVVKNVTALVLNDLRAETRLFDSIIFDSYQNMTENCVYYHIYNVNDNNSVIEALKTGKINVENIVYAYNTKNNIQIGTLKKPKTTGYFSVVRDTDCNVDFFTCFETEKDIRKFMESQIPKLVRHVIAYPSSYPLLYTKYIMPNVIFCEETNLG